MPKNLLVADDSLTIRKVIGMVFATEDFQITAVDNGIDAIARARELRPDVVLADVMMPGKSGYEVCEALKSDPATQRIPVLLLAGTFEPFDENRARAARADDHITKPFESQALLDKVKTLVGLRRRPADDAGPSGVRDRAAAGDLAAGGAAGRASPWPRRAPRPAPTGASAPVAAPPARARPPGAPQPGMPGPARACRRVRRGPAPAPMAGAAAPGAAACRSGAPCTPAGRARPARPAGHAPAPGGLPGCRRSSSAVAPCRERLVRACRRSRVGLRPVRRRR